MKKLIALILFCVFNISYSNLEVDREKSKNLHIDKTANNIPLVNIENPNSNGISHNIFKEYNVGKDGIILNNSTRDLEMTKLAGLINENPNLNRAATTILTEVSGVNRTKIEGFTEIAGQRADYILANPNGIYINGAGFINTGNVTLSTGRGDDLQNPERGQIEIAGKGLDLRNINKSELIARTAKLTAPIYGGEEVNIKLGSKKKENKPEIALDARNLGSIYAGRIRIILTEEGVGVKSAANIYATKGDVIIDTKGRVYLKDSQAKNNMDIKSKETEIEEKLIAENSFKVEGNLKNKGNILVNNSIEVKGNVENNKKISSNNSINISGNLLNNKDLDAKKLESGNIDNVGKILALDNINANDINNKGDINTKEIENKELINSGKINSQKIESESLKNEGKILTKSIDTKDIKNSGQLNVIENISSDTLENFNLGKIITENINISNIENYGNISSNKIENISLINEGKIEADEIKNNEIKNKNSLIVNKSISSDKLINFSTADLRTEEINIKEIENSGKVISRNIENIKLKNTGSVLAENINTEEIENKKSIISTKTLSANSINNSNIANIYSANLNSKSIENAGKIEAKILNLDEFSNSGETLVENIRATKIRNSNNLTAIKEITADKLENTGKVNSILTDIKNIENEKELNSKLVKAEKILNEGKILSETLNSAKLKNKGLVFSINLESDSIENNKNIEVVKTLKVNSLDNSDNTELKAKDFEAKNINNRGTIRINNNVGATEIVNSGKFYIGNDLKVKKLNNTAKIESKEAEITESLKNINGKINTENINILGSHIENINGEISAKNNLKIEIENDFKLEGIYLANNLLEINAKSFTNNSDFENNGSISLNLKGNLVNSKKITSGKDLKINADSITNKGKMEAVSSTDIDTKTLKNDGSINLGINKNKVKIKNELVNSGFLSSIGTADISAKELENKGQIATNKDLKIDADNITNSNGAVLYSTENMDITFKKKFLNEKADIYSAGNLDIKGINGDFENRVGDITSIGNLKIEAKNIRNIGELIGNAYVDGKVSESQSNVDMSSDEVKKYTKKSDELIREFFRLHIAPKNSVIRDFVRHDGRPGEKYMDDEKRTGSWTWFWNKDLNRVWIKEIDKVVSNYTSNLATIKSDKNISLIAKQNIENIEGNILANKNIDIKADKLINKNILKKFEREVEFRRSFEFHGRAMYTAKENTYYLNGQIINYNEDRGDVIIKGKIDSYVGSDKKSTISAGGNLVINAAKVGNGVFAENTRTNITKKNTNVDSVIFNKKNIDEREVINTSNYIFIPNSGSLDEREDSILKEKNKEKIDKKELFSKIDEIKKEKYDSDKNIGTGLFKLNKIDKNSTKPGFTYLIETNIKFLDKSLYLGSDYFFKRINFNPDRDIRLLGDSFYETRLINKTVLEGTGRRYLHNFKSEKEQMQYLYDNGAEAQKDLNLSLGIALTKEQINKLNKDIIWYVEEEVAGEKVLVPKLYLTKATLANLKKANSSLEAGENLVITAKELNNTGNISAKKIELNIDNLTNKALLGAEKANIEGTNIDITAKNSVDNIGGNIESVENLNIIAENIANLSTKRINGATFDVISTLEEVATISGKNVSMEAKKSIDNKGAQINAIENLNIVAEDVNIDKLETERYYRSGDRKNYVVINNKENIKSEVSARNININAGNDLNIKAADVVAKDKLNLKAEGDINIVSATDSQYYEKKETSKKRFGGSKSSHSINYSTHNVESNIVGNNINIESGKDVAVLGSNIQAGVEGEANISAKGNITQAGVKDINYSYHKTSKSRFGGLISKSTTTENYQESAIKSATISGNKGLVYDSKNDLVLEGVNVVSTGNIKLKGNNVIINPLETESYSKVKTEKKGFAGSISPTNISVSYGKDKFSSDTTTVTQHSSEITSSQNIDIEAGNKVKGKSVNIYADKDINISGDKGVELTTANNTYENITKQSSSRIGASVGVNSAIVNTIENIKNVEKLTDFSGNSYDIANTASKLVGVIKDGAKATIAIADTNYNGATDAGYNNLKVMNDAFKASISYNKSKSESKVHNEAVEKNSLVSGRNMNIRSKDGSIIISGADIKVGNDLDLNAKKDIEIKASEENFTSSNSSSQTGISLNVDLSKGQIADLSVSKAGTRGKGNGTNHINSTIDVGGKLKTDSENLTLSGANVEADKLDIKAKNLVIESKQDKSERKDSSYGGSLSIDLVNPSSFSANINGSKGNGEKEWVDKQTTLIARNGGKVDTDSLTNIGAVIGSESSDNKLKISANKITVNDLEDKNKYENIGGGISIGTDVPNISVKHDKVDKEQINRASAINTDITLNGEKAKAEDLGFNTDKNKAQEKIKDEEKHLDAELHTDLIGADKRNEIKKAGGILEDIGTALTSTDKTKGDLLERYKQASMMRAIGEQVEKNPEYLSILEKNVIKNGKIDDKSQVEQVSVINKLLNEALRAKGYKGAEIKMVLTDVTDPKGAYYTDTLTNTVVFDRNKLANANRDEILNALGHEFGHYSKEDDIDKSQDIANYTGGLLEKRTKNLVSKEVTEETLGAIRNNKNVITGEEGKKLAESIPMDRREYDAFVFNKSASFFGPKFGIGLGVTHAIVIDDNTGETFYALVLNQKGGLATSPSLKFDFSAGKIDDINRPEELNRVSLDGSASANIKWIPLLQVEANGSIDLIGKKINPISVGVSGSYEPKKANEVINKHIKSAKVQGKLGPIELSGSINTNELIYKIKIDSKESEKLYNLNLREQEIDKKLKNEKLSKVERNELEKEKNQINEKMEELAERMKNRFDLKIPKVDPDIFD
ncbi:hemagglutinin repeat-containing protein [Fusobacterium russii]|uniref:hemagglutinin repeat-containing protein n=1 Tax=Fusobacterium russii TaxID=854 RepID=UPI0003A87DAE|nr:hemagglutinin repeat-containing protein [Fusobacterium russii]